MIGRIRLARTKPGMVGGRTEQTFLDFLFEGESDLETLDMLESALRSVREKLRIDPEPGGLIDMDADHRPEYVAPPVPYSALKKKRSTAITPEDQPKEPEAPSRSEVLSELEQIDRG